MPNSNAPEKPQRLYFKSYLQVVRNSVGSKMFRNFYVKTAEAGEFDAFNNGENSCGFFVSAILSIFHKISRVHGTVQTTVEDLKKSHWQEVKAPKPGDVLVWESLDNNEHIGFYIGEGRAISTSSQAKTPVEHQQNFGSSNRKIIQIFRMEDWEDDTPAS